MAYNSTIRTKFGNCGICGKWDALTKKQCQSCYWTGIKMKSVNKMSELEIESEEGLPELIEEADILFSRYVRMVNADKEGLVACYTCGDIKHYKEQQCGHYISRGCLYLRHDLRNARVQCKACNEYKSGNLLVYGKRLEEEKPGITEILYEESKLVYHTSREEMRTIIADYSSKIKSLQ